MARWPRMTVTSTLPSIRWRIVLLCVLNSCYMDFLNWAMSKELLWTLALLFRSCPRQSGSSHQAEHRWFTIWFLLRGIVMKWCVNLFIMVLCLYPVNVLCFHCCQKRRIWLFWKNCQPVALLCAEHKIISKCLSNWLKEYLGLLVHKDQSYCVPDRSIVDNLFLICAPYVTDTSNSGLCVPCTGC